MVVPTAPVAVELAPIEVDRREYGTRPLFRSADRAPGFCVLREVVPSAVEGGRGG